MQEAFKRFTRKARTKKRRAFKGLQMLLEEGSVLDDGCSEPGRTVKLSYCLPIPNTMVDNMAKNLAKCFLDVGPKPNYAKP